MEALEQWELLECQELQLEWLEEEELMQRNQVEILEWAVHLDILGLRLEVHKV